MYEIIRNYVESPKKNGLFLLNAPTGSGKTYSVVKFIHDEFIKNTNKRFIFVTTLKKNLPVDQLGSFFCTPEEKALFEKEHLLIESNLDSVRKGLMELPEEAIPKEVRKWQEYKKLKEDLFDLKPGEYEKLIREDREEKLRKKLEPEFRDRIRRTYLSDPNIQEQLLDLIQFDERWQWIGRLYPAVFTSRKHLLFMSADKFFVRNTTLVAPSYYFFDSEIIQNAVIFIDEFDATKDTLLKVLIREGLEGKIDCIEAFSEIHASLRSHQFPTVLTSVPKGMEDKGSLQAILKGLKQDAQKVSDKFSLQFNHKIRSEGQNFGSYFLFHDFEYFTVRNSRQGFIGIRKDEGDRLNYVEFCSEMPQAEEESVPALLGWLQHFFKVFEYSVWVLAVNYEKVRNERHSSERKIFFEQCVHSILGEFLDQDTYIDYFLPRVLLQPVTYRRPPVQMEDDGTFFSNGFQYFLFQDSLNHDLKSRIMLYSFQNTPEKLLLHICQKAKVVGISATATLPSCIANYDVDYLKFRLGDAFWEMSGEERKRIQDAFQDSQNSYEGVHVHSELLGSTVWDEKICVDLFDGNEDFGARFYYTVNCEIPEDSSRGNNFHRLRMFRIACAFKQFLIHEDIQSFLCVLTKHPKAGDASLKTGLLLELFQQLCEMFAPSFNAGDLVVQLIGENYESNKELVLKRLGEGEKLFVISAYQTLGAGQNLQYPIPESRKDSLICLNEDRAGAEKDFDAIYLDDPTHLIVNLNTDDLTEEEFAKFLFQQEYLLEAGDISLSEAQNQIRGAFSWFMSKSKLDEKSMSKTQALLYSVKYRDCRSVRRAAGRSVIQAVGRICRTPWKPKHVYVYGDIALAEHVDLSFMQDEMCNYELLELKEAIERCRDQRRQAYSDENANLKNQGNLVNARAKCTIEKRLSNMHSSSGMNRWDQLRDWTMKYPTCVLNEIADPQERAYCRHFSLQLPEPGNRYYYSKEGDFDSVQINFLPDPLSFPFVMSEEDCGLAQLMKIPEMRTFFESKGFATKFVLGDHALSPVVYNNIYKGRIGEAVGEYWFSNLVGVELERISEEEKFEMFDYRIPGSDIYVDMKNWHVTNRFLERDQLNKIILKAGICKARCVIVVNVMADGFHPSRRCLSNHVELLEVPGLIEASSSQFRLDALTQVRRCISDFSNGSLNSEKKEENHESK